MLNQINAKNEAPWPTRACRPRSRGLGVPSQAQLRRTLPWMVLSFPARPRGCIPNPAFLKRRLDEKLRDTLANGCQGSANVVRSSAAARLAFGYGCDPGALPEKTGG